MSEDQKPRRRGRPAKQEVSEKVEEVGASKEFNEASTALKQQREYLANKGDAQDEWYILHMGKLLKKTRWKNSSSRKCTKNLSVGGCCNIKSSCR